MTARRRAGRRVSDERGSVLLVGLVLTAAITLLGGALLNLGVLESGLVQGDVRAVQALYCTEGLLSDVGRAQKPTREDIAEGDLDSSSGTFATPSGAYTYTIVNPAPGVVRINCAQGSTSRTIEATLTLGPPPDYDILGVAAWRECRDLGCP